MESFKVTPDERELSGIELSSQDTIELIQHAQQSDATDRQLTIRQALMKYKKAVSWSVLLSTSLIMEVRGSSEPGQQAVLTQRRDTIWSSCVETPTPLKLGRVASRLKNVYTDHLLLRPDTIPEPLWNIQCQPRPQHHFSSMAVWSVKLGAGRPARRTIGECICPRSIRLQTDLDVLHDLDGYHGFHSCLCTVSTCIGLR